MYDVTYHVKSSKCNKLVIITEKKVINIKNKLLVTSGEGTITG